MILVWVVKCDICGREFDATKESFFETENGQECERCFKDDYDINKFGTHTDSVFAE